VKVPFPTTGQLMAWQPPIYEWEIKVLSLFGKISLQTLN